jgi:anti-anti-sigma regulatory factor
MLAAMETGPASVPRPRDGWTTLGEQANHRIERRGRSLWVSVWRRPDLDTATGAALAQALVDTLLAALAGPAGPRTVVLDLRQAPPISGPATADSLGRLMHACEQSGVTVAIVRGGDALAALQLGRLVREHAPRLGQVLEDAAAAEALLKPTRGA